MFFRYVSDVGFDGYKWFCQFKALQCANIEPQLSRIYPPCLLEWRAAQRKANMALEVRFADSELSLVFKMPVEDKMYYGITCGIQAGGWAASISLSGA